MEVSAQALGGACPLTRQAMGVPRHPRLELPVGSGQGTFLDPHPQQAGKGPRRPPAGRVRDGAHGDPGAGRHLGGLGRAWGACSPARTGPAEGRLHSRRARLPAARPARGGGGRTPGGSGDQGAGAGRGWAGPPPRLREPGGRPRGQARGSGEAGAGRHRCSLARPLLRVVRTTPAAPTRLPAPRGALVCN